MIVENQINIKCHLAATENLIQGIAALAAGSNYNLGTAFPFAYELFKKGKINPNKLGIIKKIAENSRHYILDSGLFTLMFGSLKGKKDEAYIEKWYQCLVEFIKLEGYTGTVVEVDCQKILGPEKAWELRERMKKDLNNRIINVFHLEDGKDGLDRLVEFSDYIALPALGLKIEKKLDHLVSLAKYVKNKKPVIDIHILGCTNQDLIRQLKFCSSCDSTTWLNAVKFGTIRTINRTEKSKNINEKRLEIFSNSFLKKSRELQLKKIIKVKDYDKKLTLSAYEFIKNMQGLVGSQK